MFASPSSRVLNSSELLYEDAEPSARWVLRKISASEVYAGLGVWNLKAATRISIKESISSIEENSDCVQSIPLLDPKKLQAEAHKLDTKFLHLGCIRVGINALTHKDLEEFILNWAQMPFDNLTQPILSFNTKQTSTHNPHFYMLFFVMDVICFSLDFQAMGWK